VRTAHLTGNAAPDGMSARSVPDAASAVQAPRRRGIFSIASCAALRLGRCMRLGFASATSSTIDKKQS
jgi:hypothetical protein